MPESRVVISNTSALVYLHHIHRLDFLWHLYGQVCITRQVLAELAAGGTTMPSLDALDWIDVREVRIPEALKLLADLGAGEASVIALALEVGPSALVLLDDRLGRRIAALNDLTFTGTAGVLVQAKRRGLIPAVKPLLENLVELGFYLRPQHMADICNIVGE